MKKANRIAKLDLSQMNKRINGILKIEPNDVAENELNMTWQSAKREGEVVGA